MSYVFTARIYLNCINTTEFFLDFSKFFIVKSTLNHDTYRVFGLFLHFNQNCRLLPKKFHAAMNDFTLNIVNNAIKPPRRVSM